MTGTRARYEEHQFKKLIPGEPEDLRKRICEALEDFGYTVLADGPIQGKRRRRKSVWRANVLEYDTRLTVALRPLSDASTEAIFDYSVEYLFTRGDRQTLEREADAIIALATEPIKRTLCAACGSESDSGGRFCRVCGTPVARHSLPTQIEVMQLSASASAAHIEITVGLIAQLLTLAIAGSMILFGSTKAIRAGWVLFCIGELLVMLNLLQAAYRLRKAVLREVGKLPAQSNSSPAIPSHEKAAISPPRFSVTDETTKLIDSQPASLGSKRTTDSMKSDVSN